MKYVKKMQRRKNICVEYNDKNASKEWKKK